MNTLEHTVSSFALSSSIFLGTNSSKLKLNNLVKHCYDNESKHKYALFRLGGDMVTRIENITLQYYFVHFII